MARDNLPGVLSVRGGESGSPSTVPLSKVTYAAAQVKYEQKSVRVLAISRRIATIRESLRTNQPYDLGGLVQPFRDEFDSHLRSLDQTTLKAVGREWISSDRVVRLLDQMEGIIEQFWQRKLIVVPGAASSAIYRLEPLPEIVEQKAQETQSHWIFIEPGTALKIASLQAEEAIVEFLQIWQRSKFYRRPEFLLDLEDRHRLVQVCETLLAVLRNDMIEEAIVVSASRRVGGAAVAGAAFLALFTSVATGIATTTTDRVMLDPIDVAQAKAAEKSAESVNVCLDLLGIEIADLRRQAAKAKGSP